MAVEKVHVDEDGKRVAVSLNAGELLVRIIELQALGLEDLRRDEVWSADDIRRILPGDNKSVAVDDGGLSRKRIDEDVLV